MLRLTFEAKPRHVLCLGAHSDDIEIGCGGTVLEFLKAWPELEITWVVLSGDERRTKEAIATSSRFLEGTHQAKVQVEHFRDGFFPSQWRSIKEWFEEFKVDLSPDLILTHSGLDHHQDHRIVSELTWNTFRNHTILEYEIPKYDGDFSSPNVFVPLGEGNCRDKVRFILEGFPSQAEKDWFDEEVFRSTLRLRGMESRSASGYAEAFFARKMSIGFSAHDDTQ